MFSPLPTWGLSSKFVTPGRAGTALRDGRNRPSAFEALFYSCGNFVVAAATSLMGGPPVQANCLTKCHHSFAHMRTKDWVTV